MGNVWDSYESCIHKNKKSSDIDMLNYLKSLSKNFALGAIESLSLTSANYYSEAIALLQKDSGNKQKIIDKH